MKKAVVLLIIDLIICSAFLTFTLKVKAQENTLETNLIGLSTYVSPNESGVSSVYQRNIEAKLDMQNIRILVDEAHDEWGTSGSPPSGFVSPRGSWANLLDELRRHGYEVQELTEGRINSALLQDYDVLIIGTAWSEFSADEIQSIKSFVVEGGGLFLTGLGWSWVKYHPSSTIDEYPMNQIAEEFGIEFNNDIIYDPTDNNGDPRSPKFYDLPTSSLTSGVSQISARQNFPCSLNTTAMVIDSIRGDSDSYTEIYKQGDHPPLLFALQYGTGRVVCLGHEGFFLDSNLYEYDNLRFGLNIIYWLSLGAEILTELSINLTPNPITENSLTTVTISGVLKRIDSDSGLGGKSITLSYSGGVIGTVDTDSEGYYTYYWRNVNLASEEYSLEATFEGDQFFDGASAAASLFVGARAATWWEMYSSWVIGAVLIVFCFSGVFVLSRWLRKQKNVNKQVIARAYCPPQI